MSSAADADASSAAATARDSGDRSVCRAGVLLGVVAAAWHAILFTSATNDNFVHLTFAKQWLAGDWPVRDFFDNGWVLQYALSAGSQLVVGDRLLSEALIVAAAWGVTTYLVCLTVLRLTRSIPVAALSALLPIVAGARGYSYPKGIVYAVAAALWWAYVGRPTTKRLLILGVWIAVAFYWRPDHGIYVALATVLAIVAAHGLRPVSIGRCALAGGTALALVAPFLLYVHLVVGLPQYAQTGLVAGQVEHLEHGTHEWPLLRLADALYTIEPAEQYAPIATLRWSPDSSAEDRRRLLDRYGLTEIPSDDDALARVRLSESAIPKLGALVNEPIVEDTAGIDRSTGTVAATSWSLRERWAFRYPWLRMRLLPSLDAQARASELAAALLFMVPMIVLLAARWISSRLSMPVTAGRLAAFAIFALLVDLAMLRNPFPVRTPDAVVLPAILFGCCVAWMWRAAAESTRPGRWLIRLGTIAFVLAMTMSIAGAGQFAPRISGWASLERARIAWRDVNAELTASPPLDYFRHRRARFTLRLAAYVRECVPPSDRLLVLWFEPEIYYFADRLMAQRHLVFAPAWAALEHEQRMTLDKVRRFAPPLALARRSALDGYARATYPALVDYVEREYGIAATVFDDGEEYMVFARRDRSPVRAFGEQKWPCFSQERSPWSQVGRPSQ